jgi:shikimate dehydrogenase
MANRITGHAAIAGVIGWPVTHSLSPALHNYWLSLHGIDGAYIPLSVNPDHLAETLAALPKLGFRGVNLTLPHKELVLPLLDSMDDAARRIGAVNTIVIQNDNKLHGMNTDAHGFSENIRPHLPAQTRKAVILGAGGAARAVCYALIQLGFTQLILTNRTRARADAIAARFPGHITVEPWDNLAGLLPGADLLVNTTSLGMHNKEPLTIDLTPLPIHALVTDIVYVPLTTPLLQQAHSRGNPTVDGLGMLIHQAIPGFTAWFGHTPEATPALRHYLLSS